MTTESRYQAQASRLHWSRQTLVTLTAELVRRNDRPMGFHYKHEYISRLVELDLQDYWRTISTSEQEATMRLLGRTYDGIKPELLYQILAREDKHAMLVAQLDKKTIPQLDIQAQALGGVTFGLRYKYELINLIIALQSEVAATSDNPKVEAVSNQPKVTATPVKIEPRQDFFSRLTGQPYQSLVQTPTARNTPAEDRPLSYAHAPLPHLQQPSPVVAYASSPYPQQPPPMVAQASSPYPQQPPTMAVPVPATTATPPLTRLTGVPFDTATWDIDRNDTSTLTLRMGEAGDECSYLNVMEPDLMQIEESSRSTSSAAVDMAAIQAEMELLHLKSLKYSDIEKMAPETAAEILDDYTGVRGTGTETALADDRETRLWTSLRNGRKNNASLSSEATAWIQTPQSEHRSSSEGYTPQSQPQWPSIKPAISRCASVETAPPSPATQPGGVARSVPVNESAESMSQDTSVAEPRRVVVEMQQTPSNEHLEHLVGPQNNSPNAEFRKAKASLPSSPKPPKATATDAERLASKSESERSQSNAPPKPGLLSSALKYFQPSAASEPSQELVSAPVTPSARSRSVTENKHAPSEPPCTTSKPELLADEVTGTSDASGSPTVSLSPVRTAHTPKKEQHSAALNPKKEQHSTAQSALKTSIKSVSKNTAKTPSNKTSSNKLHVATADTAPGGNSSSAQKTDSAPQASDPKDGEHDTWVDEVVGSLSPADARSANELAAFSKQTKHLNRALARKPKLVALFAHLNAPRVVQPPTLETSAYESRGFFPPNWNVDPYPATLALRDFQHKLKTVYGKEP